MESSSIKKSKETLKRIDSGSDMKDKLLGGKFNFLTLIYLWFRSTTLIQGSFNYAYFQGTGYSAAMYPFFKRIYKSNKEKLKSALIENIEFFNTGPSFGVQAIMTLHLYMLQTGQTDARAKTIKFALMGPLAGINDSLFNFGSQPLIAGIAASLSADGSWTGFWTWILIYNGFAFAMGIVLTLLTYKSGEKFMSNIASIMNSVVKIASMIGITIISVLAIQYTGFSIGLKSTQVILSDGSLTTSVQAYQTSVLDKFLPAMLPILLVSFTYLMMQKRNWSLYKSLIIIILLGVSLYVFGIMTL